MQPCFKKIIPLFILIFLGIQATAQNQTLSGKITDKESQAPLAGASVYFPDLKRGASSNADGNFFLSGITAGNHLLEITFVGYNPISQVVHVAGETSLNFELSKEVVEHAAVIVTGVTRATKLKSMPFSVDILSNKQLGMSGAPNLMQSLSSLPGVSTTSTGPSISKPVIRGMGYNRVVTLSDGMRQEGQQWGDEHGIEIDEFSVNKVEILKGPASLIYGSDAMGGVVNIIQNVPAPVNRFTANVGTGYHTNNALRYGFANLAGNKNGFNWRLFGSQKEAADYKNRADGYVFNSKFNEQNIGGYVGYNGSWGFSHLILNTYRNRPGLVEGERNEQGDFLKLNLNGEEEVVTRADNRKTNPFIPYQDVHHHKILLDNHFNIGRQHVSVNTGWQQNLREEMGDPENPSLRELFFDLKTFTYNIRWDIESNNGWKPSVGINGMKQKNTNRGEEQIIPDYTSNDLGLFIYVQKELNKITLSGGIRGDIKKLKLNDLMEEDEIKRNGFDRSFNNLSASAGLAYQAHENVTLKLNAARAFRAPTASELTSFGRHEGTFRFEYGNPNLKSETSFQTDASVEWVNEHFHFGIAGYYNWFSNYIFYNKLINAAGRDSLIVIGNDEVPAFEFAQSNARLRGMEVSLDIHPHPVHWLHLENTFSFVNGNFAEKKDRSDHLPLMPAPKLMTELRADIEKTGSTFTNSFIKFEVENTFRQSRPFTGYNTETATPSYTLLNAGIGTDLKSTAGKTLLNLAVLVNNITDVSYQNHLSRLKYAPVNPFTGQQGIFNMGRNFVFKISMPINVELK